MRAEAIRERLAQGPATWADLSEASGLTEARCMAEVSKLQAEGCVIDVDHVTHLTLTYDPQRPGERHCAECGATISVYNPSQYCCLHRHEHMASLLDALETDEQLTIGAREPSPFDDLHEVAAEATGLSVDDVRMMA